MPVYIFKCERCGRERRVSLPVDERDTTAVLCDNPECELSPTDPSVMTRQPTAPNFVIHGLSAKNGYSR